MRNTILTSCSLLLVLAATGPAGARAATPPPAGGANQRVSVEGCQNQWLFDGVWRVRVSNVSPTGSDATLEVRNGTKDTLSAPDGGFAKVNGQGIDMAFDDGSVQGLDLGATQESYRSELSYKKLPPGGGAKTTLHFAPPPNPSAKPLKLLIAVDPHYNSYVHYPTKDPSFRVRVDCTK
ncbi:MAG: hypothetical protein QOI11_950 [Candidatus Eremiobacteraeota bacterium]|jgi:hypothetical protein|nr:hypothetical protein [Candidatus Eremiobacteraeota bacterium]